jgi:Circadian oscillating protein COP23
VPRNLPVNRDFSAILPLELPSPCIKTVKVVSNPGFAGLPITSPVPATPQQRCEEVSGRLETYRRNGQLKFITVGRMNNQNVICTASQINGRCEGLIYTLKPSQDAIRTLNNFLAWREGQAGAPSLSESRQVPYIDVSSRLDDGNAPASPAPNNTQPAAPQPAQNQGGMRDL